MEPWKKSAWIAFGSLMALTTILSVFWSAFYEEATFWAVFGLLCAWYIVVALLVMVIVYGSDAQEKRAARRRERERTA